MDVSTTQLGATVSSAAPSSTMTQPRTCGIQLRAVVRLGLGIRERKLSPSQELGSQNLCGKGSGWNQNSNREGLELMLYHWDRMTYTLLCSQPVTVTLWALKMAVVVIPMMTLC